MVTTRSGHYNASPDDRLNTRRSSHSPHNSIRTRLKDKVGEKLSREFPVGAWVRVYRPPSSKVAVAFSEPRKIVEITSEATRLVEKADGKRNIEYIANLNPYSHVHDIAAPSVP